MFSEQNEYSSREKDAIRIIRNYLIHHGELPTVRKLMTELGYKSPRSAAEVIERLIEKGMLERKSNGKLKFIGADKPEIENAETVDIPLVGDVACGIPILAEENVKALIPVSVRIVKPNHRYFFLRAKGDSMNEAGIENGDLVLIRQQNTAENGDLVVALIDDTATIKEFQRTNDMIILKPRSTNKSHQPIILTRDFKVQGIVVTTIKNL